MIWLILIGAVAFLASGAALAYVVGASAVLTFLAVDKVRFLAVLPQRIFSQLDVFALMAMSLFILTGEIMNRMGLTRVLVDFSMTLVGRFKGGLGHVNVLTSVFFAGVSGSAVADAAALSNTLVPAMREQGYTNRYAGAITAASAIIGPIIPPSIILIFYGALMQVSIGGLFAAGIIPGLVLAAALIAANAFIANKYNHPGGKESDIPPFWPTARRAVPALSLPVIILGGIVFGVVTPTEAAGLAVVAAVGAGFIYGQMSGAALYESFERTAILTGSIFLVMSAGACAAWIGALEQWPQRIAETVVAWGLTGVSFVLVVNVVFLIAGMFMDLPMALALLVPLFGPACIAQGVNPIHLGIILCLNLTMGLATPPLGGCLTVVSTISGEPYWSLARATIPLMLVEVVVLVMITLIPDISLFLPRFFGFI